MHACVYLYTSRFPTDEVINAAMEPYCEYESVGDEPFKWDGYYLGGRYGGKIKLRAERSEEPGEYEIGFYSALRRAGRVFRCHFLEMVARGLLEYSHFDPKSGLFDETEALLYCGVRDGWINCDGARVRDILNLTEACDQCGIIIQADGTVHVRKRWDRDSREWITDEAFDDKARQIAMDQPPENYLTVLDIHF